MATGNFVPSPSCFAYDRGQQSFLITAANGTANIPQVGTAAPVNANIVGLPDSHAYESTSHMITLQIDATGTLAGTVKLLGSLDNVNFYSLGSFAVAAATGQIIPNFGVTARYLSASLTGTSGSGTIAVSFEA